MPAPRNLNKVDKSYEPYNTRKAYRSPVYKTISPMPGALPRTPPGGSSLREPAFVHVLPVFSLGSRVCPPAPALLAGWLCHSVFREMLLLPCSAAPGMPSSRWSELPLEGKADPYAPTCRRCPGLAGRSFGRRDGEHSGKDPRLYGGQRRAPKV